VAASLILIVGIWFVIYNHKLFVKTYKDHDNYIYADLKVNDAIFEVQKP
jgi:hypothetical protein